MFFVCDNKVGGLWLMGIFLLVQPKGDNCPGLQAGVCKKEVLGFSHFQWLKPISAFPFTPG